MAKMAKISKRRSDRCLREAEKNLKAAEASVKSGDPEEALINYALAEINQIVGIVNRRMEDLNSADTREQANRNLEAYLAVVEGDQPCRLEPGKNPTPLLNSEE
jgi:hypothetical protein